MNTTDLTFNDLPKVVGELCEKIAGMENLLRDTLNRQSEPKENLSRTNDSAGSLCLSENASLHLLLQDKEGQHSGYQTRKAPLYLS